MVVLVVLVQGGALNCDGIGTVEFHGRWPMTYWHRLLQQQGRRRPGLTCPLSKTVYPPPQFTYVNVNTVFSLRPHMKRCI